MSDKLREAVERTWEALDADESKDTERVPIGVKWLLELNEAVARLRAALADSATKATKRSPEETRGEHELGHCWCGAHHDAPPSTNPDTSVDGEPTDKMVRAALTIETDEGGPISQDIGFGMMRLMLRAALAVQQKGEG